MEITVEGKESEYNNANHNKGLVNSPPSRYSEAEDRDRVARDLKAGLHPLKLGGLNSMLVNEINPSIPMVSKTSTIILGMDVSHGSPGQSDIPSIDVVKEASIAALKQTQALISCLKCRSCALQSCIHWIVTLNYVSYSLSSDEELCIVARLHSKDNKAAKFVFWYTRRTPGVRSQTSYEDNVKKIVDFSTAEAFWVCYCHLARPSTLPSPTDLHLFKDGIRPLWEDSANCNGGKWIIRFKKAITDRFWEDLVLALVGDQLDYSEDICGAVLSVRFSEDILSVWNRNASDHQSVMALKDSIKRHLKLPHGYVMEYKAHDTSFRDKSSYRNTWLRG